MTTQLIAGDCIEQMRILRENGVLIDSVVTDPPYHLTSIVKRFGGKNAKAAQEGSDGRYARASAGFMNRTWDGGDIAFRPETWRLCYDLMKPGAHLVAFSGTRTYHRMACAIEDAGFEVRDMLTWNYGTGFPKSHNVSKGIDRANGDKRPVTGSRQAHDMRGGNLMEASQGLAKGKMEYHYTSAASAASAAWDGWGTALKPALEPICLARKPLSKKTVAANVLEHGTGALNIDACRIEFASQEDMAAAAAAAAAQRLCHDEPGRTYGGIGKTGFTDPRGSLAPYLANMDKGRWPANVLHDGSDEVMAAFPEGISGSPVNQRNSDKFRDTYGAFKGTDEGFPGRSDSGSAARFFFSAKADAEDRWGSKHPTVKPVELIRWLARLITPPGGTLLDPFAGSGTAGVAALAEGFSAILIEREEQYLADIRERLAFYSGEGRHSLSSKNRNARPTTAAPLLDAMEKPMPARAGPEVA